MQLTPLKSPFPSPTRGFPLPAPLAFTPTKIQEKCETPVTPSVENVQTQEEVSCLNCDAQMTPDHQCESVNTETSESDKPEVVATVETELKFDEEEMSDEEEVTESELLELFKERNRLRNVMIAKKQKELEEGKKPKCWNCEAEFTFDHRCSKG